MHGVSIWCRLLHRDAGECFAPLYCFCAARGKPLKMLPGSWGECSQRQQNIFWTGHEHTAKQRLSQWLHIDFYLSLKTCKLAISSEDASECWNMKPKWLLPTECAHIHLLSLLSIILMVLTQKSWRGAHRTNKPGQAGRNSFWTPAAGICNLRLHGKHNHSSSSALPHMNRFSYTENALMGAASKSKMRSGSQTRNIIFALRSCAEICSKWSLEAPEKARNPEKYPAPGSLKIQFFANVLTIFFAACLFNPIF